MIKWLWFSLCSLFIFHASAQNMMVRLRAINMTPVESGTATTIGGDVKLDSDNVPEVDFSYFFSENFAMELILASTTHSASVYGSTLNNIDLGRVSLLPPTLLAQYHHTFGKFKPYVGAGINYTFFYGEDPGTAKTVEYDNSFGWALQLGADYEIAKNVYLNFDVKRIALSTDIKVVTYSNGTVTADTDINPIVTGIGVGFRF